MRRGKKWIQQQNLKISSPHSLPPPSFSLSNLLAKYYGQIP